MGAAENRDRTPGAATLEEVARVAGVSRATVSRVVNDSPRVSPDVRLAVAVAIRQLGYTPNRAARSLVTRRSDSIAVVITEPPGRLFSPEHGDEARTIRYLTGGHVDGALLVSLHADDPIPAALLARGAPFVFVGRPPAGTHVSYVDVDNRQGGRRATRHLLETGCRRVATIAGPEDMPPGIDRLEGYREALRAAGIGADAQLVARGDFTSEGGALAMERLLDACPDIDGVFAASDLMSCSAATGSGSPPRSRTG